MSKPRKKAAAAGSGGHGELNQDALLRAAADRLVAGRVVLASRMPLFSILVSRLRPQPVFGVETMGVMANGRLLYDPLFVNGTPLEELIGSLCHEVLHLVGDVFGRRGERDAETWNEAHDYAINPIVIEGGLKLPDGVLLDSRFDGMTAETIYDILWQRKQQASAGGKPARKGRTPKTIGRTGCGCADHAHPDNQRFASGEYQPGDMTPADWRRAAIEAAEAARAAGRIGAKLQRWLDDLFEPELDWESVLLITAQKGFGEPTPTYRRPSRFTSFDGDLVLPGWEEESREGRIALDTSASIDRDAMVRFASETQRIIHLASGNCKIYVCDAAIANEVENPDDIRDVAIVGGGGTSFVPVFRRIEDELGDPCRLLVYFTDLDGQFPDEAPPYPVVWCVPAHLKDRHCRPPFGTVLYVPVGVPAPGRLVTA